jgi:hypothetical protein
MARRFNLSWQRWNSADVDQLRRSAAAGMTMKEAADAIGRAHCAVKCKAMREGIRFPRKGGKPGARGQWCEVRNPVEGSAKLKDAILALAVGRDRRRELR